MIQIFDKMSDAFRIADIVVLPSQSESFGYAALESLSLGIMTILNNIPTFKEIAEGSKNNYFFENSVNSLYELLRKKINESLERTNQSKEWFDRYSIIKFGERYLNLY